MAERPNYPQIPSTLWWGLRQALRKTPGATVDEKYLAVNLNVQPTAARQYVTELKRVGLLNQEGRATPLAMKWRSDETYREAADEIVRACYPESLLNVAPLGEADRAKVTSWFLHNGLGEGTARNKAATYMMIANDPIQDAPESRSGSSAKTAPAERRLLKRDSPPKRERPVRQNGSNRIEALPLNVNVQIRISADASSEQIQAIFSSMRQYLYNEPAS